MGNPVSSLSLSRVCRWCVCVLCVGLSLSVSVEDEGAAISLTSNTSHLQPTTRQTGNCPLPSKTQTDHEIFSLERNSIRIRILNKRKKRVGNQIDHLKMSSSGKRTDGLSNRYSYQHSYAPPAVSGSFAQQQTQIIEDTMKTHYETEATSAAVLSQMRQQRQQLQGAQSNAWEMREAAEKAKRDLTSMAARQRRKKLKLQIIAGALALIDLILFLRLIQCGGSFFCKRRNNNYY